MCGWKYEKSENKEYEKYRLIKNVGVKGAFISKKEKISNSYVLNYGRINR